MKVHCDQTMAGQLGITKTYLKLKDKYLWPKIHLSIKDYLRSSVRHFQAKETSIFTTWTIIWIDVTSITNEKFNYDTSWVVSTVECNRVIMAKCFLLFLFSLFSSFHDIYVVISRNLVFLYLLNYQVLGCRWTDRSFIWPRKWGVRRTN